MVKNIDWIMMTFLVLICLVQPLIAAIIPFDFKHVERLNETDLQSYKSSENVRVVLYFKRDMSRLRAFFNELDKSAKYLNMYGTRIGIFDCSENVALPDCNKDKVEMFLFTYRHGIELLRLELDTMFDVNSIMSNILQLVLLREVPILQTLDSRKTLEDHHKGQYNIIFGLQKAIGTYEHRIFMEVAFAYQDKFKFAVATDPAVAFGLDTPAEDENALIFVLYCNDAEPKDKRCHSLRYKDKMDLFSLARFVKALTLPKVFDLPGDGYKMPFSYKDTHIMYMYYNEVSKADVMEKSKGLIKAFHGLVAIVTVNIDKVDLSGLHDNVAAPALGLQLRRETVPVFMQELWHGDNIYDFIVLRLQMGLGEERNKQPTQETQYTYAERSENQEDQPFNVEEVETQDDQVAESVYRSRKISMDLDLVPALTGSTFQSAVSNSSLIFILFYLPFCSKSMAFLRAYGDASRQLNSERVQPLARINCHDWTDVCGKNNIAAYPTLRIYQDGKKLKDFQGPLDTDIVVQTVRLLQYENPVSLTSLTQVDSFIKGGNALISENASNSSVLGLFDNTDMKETAVFQEVTGLLRDRLMFGICMGEVAKQIAERYRKSTPLILVFKRNDPYQIQVMYHGAIVTSQLLQFLVDAVVPVLPQLNALLFPQLYMKKQPFVVLFSDGQDISRNAHAVLRQIAMSRMFPDLLFCWMFVGDMESIGAQILFEYNKAVLPPALSFVRLQEAAVFNFKDDKLSFEGVTEWLQAVQSKKIHPSTILPQGDWKPQSKGYDFLKIMAWEAKYGPDTPDPDSKDAEEFDEDYFGSRDLEGDKDSQYDSDIRQELLQSRSSRLYHSQDKKADGQQRKSEQIVEKEGRYDLEDNTVQDDVGEYEKKAADILQESQKENGNYKDKNKVTGKMETKNENAHKSAPVKQKVDSDRHTEL